MLLKIIFWIYALSFHKHGIQPAQIKCDKSISIAYREGIIGETKLFPWVGVFRVLIHEETSLKVALTGIILIKKRFVIASADDVVKIPRDIVLRNSHAMFIPQNQQPWQCGVKDYITHPEYGRDSLTAIAIMELDDEAPMKPVCWPPYGFNTKNQLYAVGYTDENNLLEKTIHKLAYLNTSLCNEFYSKIGLVEKSLAPKHFLCGFSENVKEDCVWDNGMAIVSNASTFWTIIGVSIHGPGCASPGKFIDLTPYLYWVETVTDLEEGPALRASFGKPAFGRGFKKSLGLEEVPLDNVLREGRPKMHPIPDITLPEKMPFAHYYPFDTSPASLFTINRLTDNIIYIHSNFSGYVGDCTNQENVLIYKDIMKFRASPRMRGSKEIGCATYMLSMFDLYYMNYSCVKIKVDSVCPDAAYINYATVLGGIENQFPENPYEIIRHYVYQPITAAPVTSFTKKSQIAKKPYWHLTSLQDSRTKYSHHNINIRLQAKFQEEGKIEILIYGPPSGYLGDKTKSLRASRKFFKPVEAKKMIDEVDNSLDIEDYVVDKLDNKTDEVNNNKDDVDNSLEMRKTHPLLGEIVVNESFRSDVSLSAILIISVVIICI